MFKTIPSRHFNIVKTHCPLISCERLSDLEFNLAVSCMNEYSLQYLETSITYIELETLPGQMNYFFEHDWPMFQQQQLHPTCLQCSADSKIIEHYKHLMPHSYTTKGISH